MWKRRAVLVGAAGSVLALGRFAWTRLAGDGGGEEPVRSLWIGAVTPTSVTATVRTGDRAEETLLVVSTDATFAHQVQSLALMPDAEHFFCRGTITGLQPDTRYHLGVTVGGRFAAQAVGRFRTPPAGAHSFSFGFASCAETGSDSPVFDAIRRKAEADEMDFFVHLGDLHYANIEKNDVGRYHAAYDRVFASPSQGAAWRSLPMYYMWDDHDYGANESGGDSASRNAAVAAYRRRVPSPPLVETGALDAVYYSFTRGRVRFVVTDLRSEASVRSTVFDAGKTRMGAAQKAWFKVELLAARDAGQFVCWVNNLPFISANRSSPSSRADDWNNYPTERTELADFIVREGLGERLFMVSGDMHALAYEDGTNNGWGGFPVLHAAPLDKGPSQKGGPYSAGPFPAEEDDDAPISQYGIVSVEDGGGSALGIRFVGLRVDRDTGAESVLIDESFTRTVPSDARSGARL